MKKKEKITAKITGLFSLLFLKLCKINDSPQRIALGFGLGVFLGILPGAGPLASLFLASILRVNRASALLGSLITNTWLSFLTFILAVKAGSAVMKLSWQEVQGGWILFLKDFHWANLLKLSILKLLIPVIAGYLVVGLISGFLSYLIILIILKSRGRTSQIR